jgi:hypothetical protein
MCLDLLDILSFWSIIYYYKFELEILYRGGVRLKEHVWIFFWFFNFVSLYVGYVHRKPICIRCSQE